MPSELNLRFPDGDHVLVTLDGEDSGLLPFASPLTERDRQELAWYLETYGAHSLGDPDDAEAARIAGRLPALGRALFDAVFQGPALRLFHRFQDDREGTRLLTVSAEHPEVLALPWELLHDSGSRGVYLFLETPRISIRRRIAGATGGRAPFRVKPRKQLHLLFVVSRPDGAGFLDPRADVRAVLDAVEEHAPGRVTWEILRPPTLDALVERLEDRDRPPVDVLHFDGHGVFDRRGGLPERFQEDRSRRLSRAEALVRAGTVGAVSAPNTGYLLFETEDGEVDFVAAQRFGENLHRHEVPLVVLSACQSAALGDGGDGDPAERAMGSVAARLTAAGLPAVLAMTHTVMVPTTRALFGEIYKDLARHRTLGESLDNARRYLANHPEKYEVQRGPDRAWLSLQDWFVPALYQTGEDPPLLKKPKSGDAAPAPPAPRSNLRPEPEAGFFGRRRDLWQIETWFAGPTRRITLTGFGGQGKTALAQEAGRWLLRTGMFQAAAFVDFARIQTVDSVAVAKNEIGSVLGTTLIDAEAARQALAGTPTLVILDNLEALAAGPLRELLDAAVGWSTAGGSRVLLTTRTPDFGHSDYKVEGTRVHRRIQLAGLGSRAWPDDALEWFGELMKLPPAPTVPAPRRGELIDLFAKVRFHPLSIRVLAQEAKTRLTTEMGERLEALLAQPTSTGASDATLPELVASLQLSLERLDPAAQALLPRLGVFQGGAMENMILEITEIPESDWKGLRRQLEAAALVEAEDLPGVTVPFLRFHPTLAPMLWAKLNLKEKQSLNFVHMEVYYHLAGYLYEKDVQSPLQARTIAFQELANLLRAIENALTEDTHYLGRFSENIIRFLSIFGLSREREHISLQAQALKNEPGTESWFFAQSNRGEYLLSAGQPNEAIANFKSMLDKIKTEPSYERAITLTRLGRSYKKNGRPDLAEREYRNAIAVLAKLTPSEEVERQRGATLVDLAESLVDRGYIGEAKATYEQSLAILEAVRDPHGQGVLLAQLGSLDFQEGNLEKAYKRYILSLNLFHEIKEPASELICWHQLGRVLEEGAQFGEAERHYREAARLAEELGDFVRAAQAWTQLGLVCLKTGRSSAAESWFRKSLTISQQEGDLVLRAHSLGNLANFLSRQPDRLFEARQLAEEGLTISKQLDPGVSEIWKHYQILSIIADQEGRHADAREHRRLARETKRNFAGTRYELRRHAPMIIAIVAAAKDANLRMQLEQSLPEVKEENRANRLIIIRRILSGERDADTLCDSLDLEDSMTVEAILAGIEDPSTLQDLILQEE